MAVRPIVEYPAEVLRRPAAPVERFDAELATLVEDMWETMYAAPGVGLAAPQVDVSLAVLVMDPGEEYDARYALVNPRIVAAEGEITWEEGCLSIPGYYAEVTRPAEVVVEAQDPTGAPLRLELEGFPAVVVQHEIDHLHGILFVDYLSPTRWRLFEKAYGRDPYRWKYGRRVRGGHR